MGTLRVCRNCHAGNAEKRCSKCHCVRYCSRDCQVNDWKSHKAVCANLSELPDWENAEVPQVVSMDQSEEEIPNDDDAALLAAQGFDLYYGKVGLLAHHGDPKDLPEGPQDDEEGLKSIKDAALAGNKAAQYLTALDYMQQENEEECLKWIKMAAHNNHAEAQMTYGCVYWLQGRNDHETDPVQAVTWMRRALEHGADQFPDTRGDVLSSKSFAAGIDTVTRTARSLYVRSFQQQMLEDDDVDGTEAMKLAADCGNLPAINIASGESISSIVSGQPYKKVSFG